jgi:hypothetical protein
VNRVKRVDGADGVDGASRTNGFDRVCARCRLWAVPVALYVAGALCCRL